MISRIIRAVKSVVPASSQLTAQDIKQIEAEKKAQEQKVQEFWLAHHPSDQQTQNSPQQQGE